MSSQHRQPHTAHDHNRPGGDRPMAASRPTARPSRVSSFTFHRSPVLRWLAAALIVPTILSTTPVAWAFPARRDDLRPKAPRLNEAVETKVEVATTGAAVDEEGEAAALA